MKKRLLFAIVLLAFCKPGSAQKIQFKTYLDRIQEEFQIHFSYQFDLVKGVKIPDFKSDSLSAILDHLGKHSAFTFENEDEENYLLFPTKKGTNILLKGTITDENNEPLPGALIVVPSQNKSGISNLNGQFKVAAKLNKQDSVYIQMVGHQQKSFAIKYFNDNNAIKINTPREAINIKEVTVSAYLSNGYKYGMLDHSIKMDVNELALLPGATETDIFTSLEALPGINSPTGKPGNLMIRGSEADKNLITYDNIPIYHTGHYFGSISPYNTMLIDQITIHKNGGQGSDRGGRIGGSIEIISENEIADSISGQATVGTAYYSASAHVPIIKDKLSVVVGFRKSWPSSFNSIKIDSISSFVFQESEIEAAFYGAAIDVLDFDYNFWDANAKINYQINSKHKLEFSALNIRNDLTFSTGSKRLRTQQSDTMILNNWGLNLKYQFNASDKFQSSINFTNSSYGEQLAEKEFQDRLQVSTTAFENTCKDFAIKNLNEWLISGSKKLHFGFETNFYNVANDRIWNVDSVGETSLVKNEYADLYSLFADYKIFDSDQKYFVSFGSRFSYYSKNNKTYFEPRLVFNYDLAKYFTLKVNGGIYHQFINHIYGSVAHTIGGITNINWKLSDDRSVLVPRTIQGSVGGIFQRKGWTLDFDLYSKLTSDITVGNFIEGTEGFYISGNNTGYGLDVLVKKSFKKFEAWVSYNYSNVTATFDTLEFEHVWNQPHILNTVIAYNYKNFRIATGWKFAEGFANTYYRAAFLTGTKNDSPIATSQDSPSMTTLYGSDPDYGSRFPSNNSLDISSSIFYLSPNKKWKVTFGAAVTNVYDNRIIIEQTVRNGIFTDGTETRFNTLGFGRIYSASLTVQWK